MNHRLVVACSFVVAAAFVSGAGCKKKEEEPPPVPSAAPPPAASPAPAPTPVAIAPEELAVPEDAAADAKPAVKARPADVAGLRACCAALAQNAASMPPPQNAYAQNAAAICQSMVAAMASGSATKAGALGAIGGMLKGAGLPPACH